MLKFNQLKTISLSLLLLAPLSWGMEKGEPIEKEVTLEASDGSTFNLVPEIAKLSETIQGFLKDAKGAGIEEAQMPIPNAKATTLALFTNLASNIQQAINQEKDSDKPLNQKIQAPDGHIFAKNLQPVVNAALQDQDLSTLEELLKLTHFLDVPQIENAVASAYIASIYKDLNEAKQKDPNFSLEAALQKELDKIEFLVLAPPTKWLLTKHWYLKKAGITDEWSIDDLMQIQTIKPYTPDQLSTNNKILIGKLVLDLRNKQLTSLDGLSKITDIKKVQVLDISNNHLVTLPVNIFNSLTALIRLGVTNNLLTTLPENIFKNTTALNFLTLSNNHLTSLPENIFNHLAALEELELDHNYLATLPENIFNRLTALRALHLGTNQLTTLPENIFKNTTALRSLHLGTNQLTTLPENIFNNLAALTGLRLSDNQLTTLPENIFNKLTALESLWLDQNQLTTLPENIFKNTTALNSLLLSNNQLSTLPENIFTKLAALKYLLLSQNQLATLPVNILNNLAALKDLILFNNPLPPEEKEKIRAKLKEIAPNAKVKFIEESRK